MALFTSVLPFVGQLMGGLISKWKVYFINKMASQKMYLISPEQLNHLQGMQDFRKFQTKG